MYYLKVEVYLPEEYRDEVVEALNDIGVLGLGTYDSVYAETSVLGHWRPLEGSHPFDGIVGEHTAAPEIKMEFRIERHRRYEVESILRCIHPYEEPAINFIELL